MSEKARELKVKTYSTTPTWVRAVEYDGTEACAEAICELWPDDFIIGVDKDNSFGGLYVLVGNGAFAVNGGDMAYHNDKDNCSFAVPKETFAELFSPAEVECE